VVVTGEHSTLDILPQKILDTPQSIGKISYCCELTSHETLSLDFSAATVTKAMSVPALASGS